MGNVEMGKNRLEHDDGLLFDKGQVSEWTRFGFSAMRRHWLLTSLVVAMFAVAGALVHYGHYPKYVATARLLAMPSEGSPGTVAAEGTASQSQLSTAAARVILSRKSLTEIATSLNLVELWPNARPKAAFWRDDLLRLIGRPPAQLNEQQKLDRIVANLEHRMTVEVADGAVEIRVEWPNPEQAKAIVDAAQAQLIAARERAELLPLVERKSTLDAQLLVAQSNVERDLGVLEVETNKKRKGAKSSTVKGMQAEGRWGAMPDARLLQLRMQILAKRRAISELEDVRRRRMADLKSQLAEQKALLGPNHPNLFDTQDKLGSLERSAPELDALRAEETTLLSEFVQRGGKDTDLSADPGPLWPTELNDDPRLHFARSRVELSLQYLQTLLRDASEAEVELAAARAQFPQRYALLEPTYVPAANAAPALWKIVLAALMCAFVVAMVFTSLLDVASGRIYEPWQVKRWVGVPVIGEVPAIRKPTVTRVEGPRA